MEFKNLELSENILKALAEMNFIEATDVQEHCMESVMQGKDIMVQSKTGSGKTAVFLLSIARIFDLQENSKALVIAPTRELALQISDEAKRIFKYYDKVKVGCFYGGVGYEKQNKLIAKGVNLIIGTPGRIIDFQKSGKIDFSEFNYIAIDEADRLFDMGFYQDIDFIFGKCRNPKERSTSIFSATLSTKVRNIAWKFMNNPDEIEVNPEEITVDAIDQRLYHITRDEKFKLLLGLLKQENHDQVLIFTNTKRECSFISKRLRDNDYKSEYLIGDMLQSKRLATLDKFKNGEINILVATDVAARGLQIDNLPLVVNYDIPEDYENYVHRIGRTARAGQSGVAITLACEKYIYGLESIETYIKQRIPVFWAEDEMLDSIVDKTKKSYHNDRKPNNKRNTRNSKNTKKPSRPKVKVNAMSMEERAAFYAKEYGKGMKKNPTHQKKKPLVIKEIKRVEKLTLWQKIKRIFKK